MSNPLTLTLGNRKSEIGRLATEVDRFAAEHGINAEALFELQLVLDELVSNVIKYAYTDKGEHEILVSLDADQSGWTAEIQDDGKEFDPLKAPAPRFDLAVHERRACGLGIHIVLSMMDSVTYRRENGRNVITVRKNTGEAHDG
jgi:anti-sigma regulatory factor (Ser/Thr protein kinase)